jgi:hypothetical protein
MARPGRSLAKRVGEAGRLLCRQLFSIVRTAPASRREPVAACPRRLSSSKIEPDRSRRRQLSKRAIGGARVWRYPGRRSHVRRNMPKHCITRAAQRAGSEARTARAKRRAAELAPVIAELRAAGMASLSGIAAALNARGGRTTWGHRYRYPSRVAQLLARLPV